MQDNPGEATLSLFSLAGCAIGVMIVIVLRFRFAFFVTPSGSRTLLYMAAVFLAVTAFTGVSLTEPIKGVETGKFPIGSSSWWAGAGAGAVSGDFQPRPWPCWERFSSWCGETRPM